MNSTYKMKYTYFHIVVISVLMLCCHASPLPVDPEEPRYIWLPDSNGKIHFVDLQDDSPPTVRFEPDADIIYYLYTRKNPTEGQVIKKGDIESIKQSNFDSSKPVKITVHGWIADYTSRTNTLIRDAFLDVMDVNMITVDWSIGANEGYTESVRNALKAAPSVGEMLDWLNSLGVNFSDMHLIGHSLGGQLVGIAARSSTLGQVEYITAMDPASPNFGINSERIRKTDAKYVELIHTNAGMLGMTDAVGHNDFYPNGGKSMPGCNELTCSHSRSTEYMAASIDHQGFMAKQCQSAAEAMAGIANCTGEHTLYMGGSRIKPEVGIFALTTDAEPPYYQGRAICSNDQFIRI